MRAPEPVGRFLVVQTVLAFIVNAAINGVAPWYFFRYQGMDALPLFGPLSVAGDTVATAFLLTFLVAVGIIITTRHDMNRGKLPRVREGLYSLGQLVWPAVRLATAAAAIATVVLPVLIVGPLWAWGMQPVDLLTFCLLKALVAGAYSAVLAPALALHTLKGN